MKRKCFIKKLKYIIVKSYIPYIDYNPMRLLNHGFIKRTYVIDIKTLTLAKKINMIRTGKLKEKVTS